MQRIPPLGFARVGALPHYVAVMAPSETMDPIHGGIVPGPPVVFARVFCAIEPFDLNVVREHIDFGGALVNMNQYLVTLWYYPGITVKMWLDWLDARDNWHHELEILAVRDQATNHRYLELLCQERVS